MKKIFLFLILFYASLSIYSQYQTFKWYVGNNNIVDFSRQDISSTLDFPEIIDSGTLLINGNNAIASDSFGIEQIQYLSGSINFPTIHQTINPIASATESPNQPAYIMGYEDISSFVFDVFTLNSIDNSGYNLYYTNGNIFASSVAIGEENQIKASSLSSKMATYNLDGIKLIVAHELGNSNFLIYNNFVSFITVPFSIGSQYGSNVGSEYDSGFMKFSQNGYRLAVSSPDMNNLLILQSDIIMPSIEEYSEINGFAFNAIEFPLGNAEKIIYAATDYEIYQIRYNLADVEQQLIGTSSNIIKNMQIGADGRIYVIKENSDYLGVIHNPEQTGEYCYYEDNSILLPTQSNGTATSFPAGYFADCPYVFWANTSGENEFCVGDIIRFELLTPGAFTNPVVWDFGDGTIDNHGVSIIDHTYSTPDTFDLKVDVYFDGNTSAWNSIQLKRKVIIKEKNWLNIQDTIICDTLNYFSLNAIFNNSYNYVWYDLNNDTISEMNEIFVNKPGIYFLDIYESGEIIAHDSAIVNMFNLDPFLINTTDDSLFFVNENLNFKAEMNQYPQAFMPINEGQILYQWFFTPDDNIGVYDLNEVSYTYNNAGSYYPKLVVNYSGCSDSVSRHIIIKSEHIIYPSDTIICSLPALVTLNAQYDNSFYFKWYNQAGDVILVGNGETQLNINDPGLYTLKIFDGATLIDQDSARIFYFQPDFEIVGDLMVDSTIEFYAHLNEIPEPYNNFEPLFYNWSFGDENSQGDYNLDYISHSYSDAGNYEVTLSVVSNSCNFDTLQNIYITDNQPVQITPGDTALCNIDDNFDMSVNLDENVYDIIWYIQITDDYANNHFEPVAQNTNSINIQAPGVYKVEAYEIASTQLFYEQEVVVGYNYCENFDLDMTINQEYEQTYCFNDSTFRFEAIINETQTLCPMSNPDEFFYFWDMGDGSVFSGQGLKSIDYSFAYGGNFLVSLYVFDDNYCEHIVKKRVNLIQKLPDTLTIDLLETSVNDIEINLKQYPVFYNDYLNNCRFFNNVQQHIFPSNQLKTNFTLPEAYIENIEDFKDIYFYFDIAYFGNLDISITTPSGKIIPIVNLNYDSLTPIIGLPEFLYSGTNFNITKTYFVGGDGDNINIPTHSPVEEIYYSPDKKLLLDNFLFITPNIYKMADTVSIIGEPVSGNWEISILGKDGYGFLNTVGIMFANKYFYQQIMPDSLIFTDEYGTEFIMTNRKFTLKNRDLEQYIIKCNGQYSVNNCNIEKTLIVNTPLIPNSFTPNGDGINDTWKPIDDDINAHVVILDKNGNILASFDNTGHIGWDGKFNGTPLPVDSYWYLIFLTEDRVLKGVLTIVR